MFFFLEMSIIKFNIVLIFIFKYLLYFLSSSVDLFLFLPVFGLDSINYNVFYMWHNYYNDSNLSSTPIGIILKVVSLDHSFILYNQTSDLNYSFLRVYPDYYIKYNILLDNRVNLIHPQFFIIILIGYSILSDNIKFFLIYDVLMCLLFLSISVFILGLYWSNQNAYWDYWWIWDLSEITVIVYLFVILVIIHNYSRFYTITLFSEIDDSFFIFFLFYKTITAIFNNSHIFINDSSDGVSSLLSIYFYIFCFLDFKKDEYVESDLTRFRGYLGYDSFDIFISISFVFISSSYFSFILGVISEKFYTLFIYFFIGIAIPIKVKNLNIVKFHFFLFFLTIVSYNNRMNFYFNLNQYTQIFSNYSFYRLFVIDQFTNFYTYSSKKFYIFDNKYTVDSVILNYFNSNDTLYLDLLSGLSFNSLIPNSNIFFLIIIIPLFLYIYKLLCSFINIIMNFISIFNWIRLNPVLPSYIAKNRLFLTYVVRLKKILNIVGFSFKSNSWYIRRVNNLLFLFSFSGLFLVIFIIFFSVILISYLRFIISSNFYIFWEFIDNLDFIFMSLSFWFFYAIIYVKHYIYFISNNNNINKVIDYIKDNSIIDIFFKSDFLLIWKFNNKSIVLKDTRELFNFESPCTTIKRVFSFNIEKFLIIDNANIEKKISKFKENTTTISNFKDLNYGINLYNNFFLPEVKNDSIKYLRFSQWVFKYYNLSSSSVNKLYNLNKKFNLINFKNIKKTNKIDNIYYNFSRFFLNTEFINNNLVNKSNMCNYNTSHKNISGLDQNYSNYMSNLKFITSDSLWLFGKFSYVNNLTSDSLLNAVNFIKLNKNNGKSDSKIKLKNEKFFIGLIDNDTYFTNNKEINIGINFYNTYCQKQKKVIPYNKNNKKKYFNGLFFM